MQCGVLYTQHELISTRSNLALDDWRMRFFNQFRENLNKLDFPCLFGRKAYQLGQCKILFVGSKGEKLVIEHLLQGFLQYTEFVKNTNIEERLLYPMIVFVQFQNVQLSKQHAYAWEILQILHENDPNCWPETIPSDPESPNWSFCFNGIELFINISAPSHLLMKSRNLAESIVLVVNPRENFDKVANVKELSGQKIRQKIRDRVCKYNQGFMPETLDSLEWKQYQLFEPNGLKLKQCPIQIKKK